MLVLTRRLMERLFIGDNVCVTVVRLESGQVRLGIEAPRDVQVVRAELVPTRAAEHDARMHPAEDSLAPPRFMTRPTEVRGIGSRRRGRSR
ncbi:MAG: carbon storage regulator [Planctomycetota bacterium]|nr:carbon storage regulator [Planctomycetota bacterium]